ncbi:GGDEF domain-containing protein [Halomonas litopenaei]|uniref:GGDEF domain-containing protein n=1 Tax=Halomonas litopenaei TaxID=2109328 RepID=UPI003F9F38D1
MWYTSLPVVRHYRLLSQGFTLLALVLAATSLMGLDTRLASLPANQTTLALALIVAIGQWRWTRQGVLTSALVSWPLCLCLVALLFGACAPEDWLPVERQSGLFSRLVTPATLLDWRPPLVELLVLTLLTLGVLARTRSSLGVPLLHMSCFLLLLLDQTPLHHWLPSAALPHDHSLIVTAILGLLLAGQWVGVVSGWRPTRDSLRRGLWPSTLLVVTTLVLWQYLEIQADNALQHLGRREGRAMEERLASEFNDVLHSLQQLQVFLAQSPVPLDSERGKQLTEPLEHHFPYLTALHLEGLQSTGSGSRSGFQSEPSPATARRTDSRPPRVVLEPRLAADASPAELAIALWLPLTHPEGHPLGRPFGHLAATLSLPAMTADMYQPGPAGAGTLQVRLAHDGHLIQEWPMRGHPSPWAVSLPLKAIPLDALSEGAATSATRYLPLELTLRPDTRLLERLRSRLPAVTLVLGLLFSQFLYLTLFSQHQMASQHRAIARSNGDLRREVRTRHRLQQQLSWLADHDELTGLPNRRHLQATAQAWRERLPLSVILVDIDHFKHINDCLGHAEGDRVLKAVARLAQETLGDNGLLGRYGGEEFLVILPEGRQADACAVAERLRRAIRQAPLAHHDGTPLTISLGVACQDHSPLDLTRLIQQADQALYLAKHQGRDRVVPFDNTADTVDSAPPAGTPSFSA